MDDVTIRAVTVGDAEAIAALAGELSYPTTAAEMTQRLTALAASQDDVVLVAIFDGMVVGWIHVAAIVGVQSPPFAEIRGMVVSEALRSRGIAATLVEAGEEWARARGLTRIRVRSNLMRERTHAFYEGRGYAPAKSQKVFDKALGDRLRRE
jgi:GNAT superfamily N-acetyltransferase